MSEAIESLLVDAIQQWMEVPTEDMRYHHGNAQGIARALAALRGTTFSDEWSAGLDRYQNRIGSSHALARPSDTPTE